MSCPLRLRIDGDSQRLETPVLLLPLSCLLCRLFQKGVNSALLFERGLPQHLRFCCVLQPLLRQLLFQSGQLSVSIQQLLPSVGPCRFDQRRRSERCSAGRFLPNICGNTPYHRRWRPEKSRGGANRCRLSTGVSEVDPGPGQLCDRGC